MQNNYSWYSGSHNSDTPDYLHQVFAYGTLDDLKEMKKSVGMAKMRDYFLKHPKKVYHRAGLHFIKKFILDITDCTDDDRYLKDTPRNTG